MLNQNMKDQWERQQKSLIALTKCLLLIRRAATFSKNTGDKEIDLIRAEITRKVIYELADAAHNLPTIISKSMMHFVTLENGYPTNEDLIKFNQYFEGELSILMRELEPSRPLPEPNPEFMTQIRPITELDELLKRRSPESQARIKNLVWDELHQPNPELMAQLEQLQKKSMLKPGEPSYGYCFDEKDVGHTIVVGHSGAGNPNPRNYAEDGEQPMNKSQIVMIIIRYFVIAAAIFVLWDAPFSGWLNWLISIVLLIFAFVLMLVQFFDPYSSEREASADNVKQINNEAENL